MLDFRIEDVFDLDPDRYWAMFFSDEFNAAMWEHLDVKWELLSMQRDGEGDSATLSRSQRLIPKREVPKVMQKFVDGAIAYTENNDWRRSENTMSVETIPSLLSDKISVNGTYWLEPRGPNKVCRVFEARCECKVPIVGKKAETFIVEEIKASYADSAKFMHQWIADHY
jgi:hypothetical protein